MSFHRKHVAITGGAGEIGLAMCREFVAQGASVTLLDQLDPEKARELTGEVSADYKTMNVTDPASVRSVIESLQPIDVAIANAGVYRGAPFLEITAEDWQLQIDVNLTGAFLFSQAAARKMIQHGRRGAILMTGSWAQEVPGPRGAAYGISKAGLRMLARCMGLELGPMGIRVNVVAPGIVNAGMAKRQLEVDPEFARLAKRSIPLGELQSAVQIAKAAAFLCSDAADAVTGAVLLVDGGASLFKYE
jgi:NAD(P)-dependent dehydrogenase (short-subunit alcohol dehydrogenase family)